MQDNKDKLGEIYNDLMPKIKMSADLEAFTNQISKNAKKITEIYSPALKNLESISEAMKPIIDRQEEMLSGIREAISKYQASLPKIEFPKIDFPKLDIQLPKIEIPEELKQLARNTRYLKFLEEVQWPLFLERDQSLRENLNQYYSDSGEYDLEGIRDTIFKFYSRDVIEGILESWKILLQDDRERYGILEQAIELHNEGKYFASTALLMSQVNGIITKADAYIKDSDYKIDEEDMKSICEYYKITYDEWKKHSDSHERAQILKFMAVTEGGFFYWDAVTKYIRDIVLKNYGEDSVAEHNPMRNKILHGVQLNYGTQEHSLKAILTVDLLMQYYAEIDEIIKNNKKEWGCRNRCCGSPF